MFDIGWTEMLVIAVVLIVVVGPKDLPKMLRTFGKFTAKMSSMAGDFRKQFDEALKEAELDEVRKSVNDLRSLNPKNEIRKAFSPMEQAAADVRASMNTVMRPKTSVPPPPASTEATASEPLKIGATGDVGDNAAKPAGDAGGEASVAPLAPAAPVAPAAPMASPAPLAEPASLAEAPVKKPRAARAPKASSPAATTDTPVKIATARATVKPAAEQLSSTSGPNGAGVDKPVRTRKPKETGTAT